MTTILITAAVLLALFLMVTWQVFKMAFGPRRKDSDDWTKIEHEGQSLVFRDRISELCEAAAECPYEDVSIRSFDGYTLYGKYYKGADGAPLEIEFHGWHGSPIGDFCGAALLARKAGRSRLAIEERAQIRSGGRAVTFGINERKDCLSWCEWAAERFGKDQEIIIAGISMGAATVLMAADLPLPGNVKGIIADCPYSSPMGILKTVGRRDMHIPGLIISPVARAAARLFGGFSITESSAIGSIRHTDLPILLIHGDDDRFVPWEMSEEMSRVNENIQFETFPGAGHGLSFMVDEQRYEKVTGDFIERVTGGKA